MDFSWRFGPTYESKGFCDFCVKLSSKNPNFLARASSARGFKLSLFAGVPHRNRPFVRVPLWRTFNFNETTQIFFAHASGARKIPASGFGGKETKKLFVRESIILAHFRFQSIISWTRQKTAIFLKSTTKYGNFLARAFGARGLAWFVLATPENYSFVTAEARTYSASIKRRTRGNGSQKPCNFSWKVSQNTKKFARCLWRSRFEMRSFGSAERQEVNLLQKANLDTCSTKEIDAKIPAICYKIVANPWNFSRLRFLAWDLIFSVLVERVQARCQLQSNCLMRKRCSKKKTQIGQFFLEIVAKPRNFLTRAPALAASWRFFSPATPHRNYHFMRAPFWGRKVNAANTRDDTRLKISRAPKLSGSSGVRCWKCVYFLVRAKTTSISVSPPWSVFDFNPKYDRCTLKRSI